MDTTRRTTLLACFLLSYLFTSPTYATLQDETAQEFTQQQLDFFENKVRPILVERCYECHKGKDAEGGLNLESRKSILKGGDTGPGIELDDPSDSLIVDAINYGDFYEMPPDSKLPQAEIDILTKWINQGAPWPSNSDIEIETGEAFDLQLRKSNHWCWDSILRPAVPSQPGDWANDPLDHFIQNRVSAAGLSVASKADRATLLRRASFDLIGLPPTRQQIQEFVVDQTIDFAEIVDQLLASPHFGERWARHWMDLTRYAETCGHEFDYPIPNAYQYRDYLIRAFNADVPYDQFVREHIAGDLIKKPRLHPTRKFNESILGTGFWFLGEATHAPVDVKGDEAGHIDNRIDVMSKTFLGLTVACARCHDHKFDAISTKDYYALAGFLQSSRRQEVMLDIDQKIEKSFRRIQPIDEESRQLVDKWMETLAQGDSSQLAMYLQAAIEIERSQPKWFVGNAIVTQGEQMRTIRSDSGIVETQRIEKTKNFQWQGDQQTWWRDAKKIGDQWELEFKVAKAGEYQISFSATVANDYGAAKLYLNDTVVSESVDFYAQNLGNRTIEIGRHTLSAGNHVIRFEVLAANENAIKRNMMGLDYLSLLPLEKKAGGVRPITVTELAETRDLDERLLENLVRSLSSTSLQTKSHPLHGVSTLLDGRQAISSSRLEQLANTIAQQGKESVQSRKDAVKYADFSTPDQQWFKTGFGFADSTRTFSFVQDNPLQILPPDVLSSGSFGKKFFGVMRSPTFELTHKHIHVRLRSRNAKIRLIIDGYVMDDYNALLFNGATVKNASHPDFQWRTLGGDIRKYVGHRAHLEFIDHNDGFVSVDEIWFSNGPGPKDSPSQLLQKSMPVTSPPKSLQEFCELTSEQIVSTFGDDEQSSKADQAQLLTWLINHDLNDLVIDPATSNVSLNDGQIRPTSQLGSEIRQLRNQVQQLSSQTPHPTLAVAMTDGTAEDEYVFVRGNHKTLGEQAPRQLLEALVGSDSERFQRLPGSGRMELVDQIVDPQNPLTSRVMVNRIWHHLMGQGIVRSVDNLGVLGSKPTHPELLDYLASEFVADDWSVKKMIRRIMLSSTYQMSSTPNPLAKDIDPDNELMHRARIRRLQGEVIRDSILTVSGELDRKLFGRSVPVHLTTFMQGRGRPGKSGPLDGAARRSIYVEVRRNFLSPMMLAFDTPIPFNATGRRNLSNVPAQALILMNDPFVVDQAGKWAKRLTQQKGSITERVKSIYLTAFGRPPTESEIKTGKQFIQVQAEELGQDPNSDSVWKDYCHVIFNVKEFIHIK